MGLRLRIVRMTYLLALDLTLVTHNTREFKRVTGLRLEAWEIDEG